MDERNWKKRNKGKIKCGGIRGRVIKRSLSKLSSLRGVVESKRGDDGGEMGCRREVEGVDGGWGNGNMGR